MKHTPDGSSPGNLEWMFGSDQSDPSPETAKEVTNSEDLTDTAEIPTIPPPLPSPEIRPLTADELSDRELRDLNFELTLQEEREKIKFKYFVKRLQLKEGYRPQPPEEYRKRFNIWKMYLQQLIPVGVLAVLGVISWGLAVNGTFAGWDFWAATGTVLLILFLVLADLWTMGRIFVLWRNTTIFSDENNTGIQQIGSTLFWIDDIKREFGTAKIQTKTFYRSKLLKFLHLNIWIVTVMPVDSDSDKDDFLKGRSFVCNGDELIDTITEMQEYLRSVSR